MAEYAARGMLRPIAVPTLDEETERMLIRRRHRLVDCIRKTKQHIKALLLELGFPEPEGLAYWTQADIGALHALDLKPMAKIALESYLRELEFQNKELREVESKVQVLMADRRHAEAYRNLQSVPGVGFVVASTFMLELFRPERFQKKEQFAAYLGLAPTVRHSGEKTPHGRLVCVGQKRLRSLLVEAAWVWRSRDDASPEGGGPVGGSPQRVFPVHEQPQPILEMKVASIRQLSIIQPSGMAISVDVEMVNAYLSAAYINGPFSILYEGAL